MERANSVKIEGKSIDFSSDSLALTLHTPPFLAARKRTQTVAPDLLKSFTANQTIPAQTVQLIK